MMPTQFDQAIKAMCSEAVTNAVAVLAAKYGFSAEEATRELNLGDLKLQRKRGPSPKAEKPVAKKAKEDKPKRAKTGYLLFADDVRAEVRAELELALEAETKLKPQDVVREIAARWKALEQSERDVWNDIAKSNVTSPLAELEEWVETADESSS